MVFSSIFFLLYFLPVFLVIYHFIDPKYKNPFLLLASIFFYGWGSPKFLPILLGSSIANFYLVRWMHLSADTKKHKIILVASIVLNLGLLAYYKYANFFVENMNSLFGVLHWKQVEWANVLLPVGISFHTFQSISYIVDVHRKVHSPLKNMTDYLAYITAFPQLIAGPIVRFTAIADELTERQETIDNKLAGFYRFTIGLAKKALIANVMAEQADQIFNSDFHQLTTANAWLGMFAYTFQIYFDFSGYSDMAIGLGRMMGFHFPENFNSPYVSQSISEFWRRWHMTLGDFMRNYLYIPLGGNRVASKSRLYFNLWVVFLVSGLWHGASWNFVIWGVYHGLFIVADRIFLLNFLQKAGKFISIPLTFFLVMLGWVIFRIENLEAIIPYFSALFNGNSSAPLSIIPAFGAIAGIAIFFSFFALSKKGRQLETVVFNQLNYSVFTHLLFTGISIILFILSVSAITSSGFNPFIYFRF